MADDAVLSGCCICGYAGLGQAQWKKAGTKMRKGWIFLMGSKVEMKYRGIPSEEDEEEVVSSCLWC